MPRFVLAPARPNLQGIVPTSRRGFISRLLGVATGGFVLGRAGRAIAAPDTVLSADPFVGEIAMVAFDWAPVGWALCNGQLLPISQNTALFSLLGTTYGGNGQSTFALPDLQGRVPLHYGNGYAIGQTGGAATHTLLATEMPAHTHAVNGDAALGTSADPAGRAPAHHPAGVPVYGTGAPAPMAPDMLGATGGSQPHNNMPPFLAINFIIALQGVYPSRS